MNFVSGSVERKIPEKRRRPSARLLRLDTDEIRVMNWFTYIRGLSRPVSDRRRMAVTGARKRLKSRVSRHCRCFHRWTIPGPHRRQAVVRMGILVSSDRGLRPILTAPPLALGPCLLEDTPQTRDCASIEKCRLDSIPGGPTRTSRELRIGPMRSIAFFSHPSTSRSPTRKCSVSPSRYVGKPAW